MSRLFETFIRQPFEEGSAYRFGCLWELIPEFGATAYVLIWLCGVCLLLKRKKDSRAADEELSEYRDGL